MSSIKKDTPLNNPFMLCSVPKCGTHLLLGIMEQILGREFIYGFGNNERSAIINEIEFNALEKVENKAYVGHFWHSQEFAEKVKEIPKIVLIRDPRDYIISMAHFKNHSRAKPDPVESFLNTLPNSEKISTVILGVRFPEGKLSSTYHAFLNYGIRWFDSNSLVVRYEDFVSSKPGDIEDRTIDTVKRIFDFVGISYSSYDLHDIIFKGIDPVHSFTFRSGKIGNWREEFEKFNIEQLKTSAPQLISKLGYEIDETWNNSLKMSNIKPIDHKVELSSTLDSVYERHKKLLCTVDSPLMIWLVNIWALDRFMENLDFENAVHILEILLSNDDKNPELNYLMAFSLHMLKRYDEALYRYNQALSTGFDEFWIRYNRGSLYFEINKVDLAQQDLEKALNLNPLHKGVQQITEKITKIKNLNP